MNTNDSRPASLAAAHGSPTDAEILDWLQARCRMDWPFGNEIQVTARCLSLHPFKDRPSLREAVAAAIKSENADVVARRSETPT